jgi:hypothetical protein
MIDLPDPGLYRTTQAMPGNEEAFPAGVLVFVGQQPNGGGRFIVRPGANRKNRWFWGEPTTPLRSPTWSAITFDGGGRWLANAIVQLGYNEQGKGILFVGEQRDQEEANALFFSDRGLAIDDDLLESLNWAPILPVRADD